MNNLDKIQAMVISIGKKMQMELFEQIPVPKLTTSQFYILKIINYYGALRASELAREMNVKPSTITVTINRLIEQGLVNRYHDREDRRAVIIELTKKGESVVEETIVARNEHIAKYLSFLEFQEKEKLLQLLEKLRAIIYRKPEKE
ncbi:MarR family transcriptional regulator [Bacillus tropicus]|uniref:MarR family transcriptional regulator n=1 Tax=Bacillus tropicus TaxID=2026188 RepID=UPI00307CEF58